MLYFSFTFYVVCTYVLTYVIKTRYWPISPTNISTSSLPTEIACVWCMYVYILRNLQGNVFVDWPTHAECLQFTWTRSWRRTSEWSRRSPASSRCYVRTHWRRSSSSRTSKWFTENVSTASGRASLLSRWFDTDGYWCLRTDVNSGGSGICSLRGQWGGHIFTWGHRTILSRWRFDDLGRDASSGSLVAKKSPRSWNVFISFGLFLSMLYIT